MVEILDETGRLRRREALRRALAQLGDEYGAPDRELTLVAVDDAAMTALNRQHRGIDAATDVLSFPLHEPDDVGMPTVSALGDVIVSLDTARRQAREHGHATWREVLVLAAHGLMHLLGHDHADAAGWRRFERAQARALALAGARRPGAGRDSR
jgi:probable rRNA maturation factor